MAVADYPVIASSDRAADLEPFCNRTYNADEQKWREIFPWEFPQKASREDEEAFLQQSFSAIDIHMFGYAFLKQAWYSMALWNFQIKMPCIADWYIRSNPEIFTDPEQHKWILADGVQIKTFFSEGEVQMWGEKMLKNVITLIQSKVKDMKEQEDEAQRTPKAKPAVPPTDVPVTASTGPGFNDPVKLEAAREFANHRGKPHTDEKRRPRGDSSAGFVPPIQGRKRGNSFNKHQGYQHGNRNTSMRYDPNRGPFNPYYNPQQPAAPQYIPSPVIGEVPPHPMHNQMRVPTGGAPSSYVPSPAAHPQALAGPPPPPGASYPPMPPQQFLDQHFQQQLPAPYAEHGFVPYEQGPPFDPRMGNQLDYHSSRVGNRGHGPYEQGPPFDPRVGNQLVYDRSNVGNRGHGYEAMLPQNQEYEGYGVGKRRDSASSRGRGRGGRASKGRNSFAGPRPQNFGDGHQGYGRRPSQDFAMRDEQQGFGYKRRNSAFNDRSWRNNGPPMQQNENAPPGRMFSDHGNAPPPQMIPEVSNTPDTQGPPLKPSDRLPRPEFSKPQQPAHEQTQPPAPPVPNLIHDPGHPNASAFPERVLSKHRIGLECSHASKVILFGVPHDVPEGMLKNYFSQFGTVQSVAMLGEKLIRGFWLRDVFIKYSNHLEARNSIAKNGGHWEPVGELRVQVPMEYWDQAHARYPGEGHPQYTAPTSNYDYHGRSGSTLIPRLGQVTSASGVPATHKEALVEEVQAGATDPVADRVPTLDQAPAAVTSAEQKETLSGATTPAASGTTTPKKKNNKKKNKKGQASREEAPQSAAKQQEKFGSEETTADARSETSEATVVHAGSASKDDRAKANDRKVDSETTPEAIPQASKDSGPASVDLKNKAAQPQDRPSSGPQDASSEMPQPAKFNTTDVPGTAGVGTTDEQPTVNQQFFTDTAQPFRAPQKTEEKTTVSKVIESDESVNHVNDDSPPSPKTSVTPQKLEDEQADDSFHTANGTPEALKDDRRQDRGSEESNASVKTIVASGEPLDLDNTPKATIHPTVQLPVSQHGASEAQTVTSPSSTVSAKSTKKVPVPMVKIAAEPLTRRTGSTNRAAEQKDNALAPSIPPTPAYVTAPNTPAPPDHITRKDSAATENASPTRTVPLDTDAGIAAQSENAASAQSLPTQANETESKSREASKEAAAASAPPQAKKAEKVKGPAQTESLSLFGKKTKPKREKSKPLKGKGSIKGKRPMDDDAVSEGPSGSGSRTVSGMSTPGVPTEDVFGPSNGKMDSIDERLETAGVDARTSARSAYQGAKQANAAPQTASPPPQSASSRDASPSKKSVLGSILGFLSGSAPASQAATPNLTSSEPSVVEPPSASKSNNTVPPPHTANPTDATDHVPDARSDSNPSNSVAPPQDPVSPVVERSDAATAAVNDAEQPFRSVRSSDAGGVVGDSGDSGGAADATVGLGITADSDLAPAPDSKAPAPNRAPGMEPDGGKDDDVESEAKNKKKRKPKKKNKKTQVAKVEDGDDDEGDTAEVVGGVGKAANVDMKVFQANTQDRFPDAASEDAQSRTVAASEPGSEASSATLGHTDTPSSTTAASSQQSPTKRLNMIKTMSGDPHLVNAPLRRKTQKRVTSTVSTKTPEAESPADDPKTVYIFNQADDGGSDEDSENPLDRAITAGMDMNKHSMKNNPPKLLYLYCGEGSQNQGIEDRTAREIAHQEGDKAEAMARARLDRQSGKENAKPGQ